MFKQNIKNINTTSNNTLYIKNNFNIKIIISLFFILSSSLLCLFSSTKDDNIIFFFKQLFFILLSIPVFIFFLKINIKFLYKNAYKILIIVLFFLTFTLFFGKRSMGASRWINLGFIYIQPSEFAKIAVVIAISKFFSQISSVKISKLSTIIKLLIIISPNFILIALQPDLATASFILIISFILLFSIGVNKQYFIFFLISFISCIPLAWAKFLKNYQKLRIINFFYPERDPFGSGYNIIQSKIAIGSGGFLGKGFLNGTQSKLKFLPEHHTDFIFTILGEEFGFIGSLIIIFCYLYIIHCGFKTIEKTNSVFCKLICIGCVSIIFFDIFINIGMISGIIPVAGIPLIMFSYGGSHLILGIICIALISNINLNK